MEPTKRCYVCGVVRPRSEFGTYLERARNRRWTNSKCRKCQLEKLSRWKSEHPEYKYHAKPGESRAYHLRKKYGWTEEDYRKVLEAQGGRCAICRQVRTLFIDHDHGSGKVRGLLCNECNGILGIFEKYDFAAFEMYLRRYGKACKVSTMRERMGHKGKASGEVLEVSQSVLGFGT